MSAAEVTREQLEETVRILAGALVDAQNNVFWAENPHDNTDSVSTAAEALVEVGFPYEGNAEAVALVAFVESVLGYHPDHRMRETAVVAP